MDEFNWVAQDSNGTITLSVTKPRKVNQISSYVYGNMEFTVMSRTTGKWEEVIIDLSKNDYIIKNGKLMATRKHAALIHAWADGAVIQYQRQVDFIWMNYADDETPAFCDPNVTLRIKPKTVRFRNYISRNNGSVKVACDGVPGDLGEWLTDWQEVEIE